MNIKRIEDHIIVTDFLDYNSVIVDCGACVGNFTKALYDEYKCYFYLYEPDPRNYRRICKRFKDEKNITILNRAIDTQQGTINFYLGNYITASSKYKSHRGLGNLVEKVHTTTLDWDFTSFDRIDLLKLDLEGAEKEVIPSLPKDFLSKVSQIVVEYHIYSQIDGYTQDDINRCREYLKSNGFAEIEYDDTVHNGGPEACYINERLL